MTTDFLHDIGITFLNTVKDVAPIIALIVFFQVLVFKKSIPDLRKVAMGIVFVIIGLTLFLIGLEKALFPVGNIMAEQLSNADFIRSVNGSDEITWASYYWIYIFAALIGFSTTIAEPSLIAVAHKAHEVSGGTVGKIMLRVIVAIGVGLSLALGTFRIVTGRYHCAVF